MEFKGTKGEWTVIENSWSDTTLVCGDVEIATKSIYHEATEDNQEQLEDEVTANFNLMASAPELLEALQEIIKIQELDTDSLEYRNAISAINKAIS